ncbi:MAG: FAD-dependent oxidoreductase [bacterium]
MKFTCDVLIVGGGVAGVPAAVAAARAGADTLLLEKRDFPGGTGVIGLHRTICGLYWNGEAVGTPLPLLNGGLVREVCVRLHDLAPERRPVRLGKVDVLPYDSEHLRAIYSQLMGAEARLRVLLGVEVTGVCLEGGRVLTVAAGEHTIIPQVVVDGSGDGVVIRGDPALHEPPPLIGRQLAGYVIHLDGLSGSDDMLPIKVPYAIRQGVDAKTLPACLRFTTFVAGGGRNEGWCKLSVPSGTPLATAQELAQRLHDALQEALPSARESRIIGSSPDVLEREGARLKGLYTLTAEDVLGARQFPDAIARSAWPIELWDPERGPTYRYLEPGKACGIPAGCLKAAAASNLYCAGRCISATHEALAATRVMGTCMALGEAAGREAALQSGGGEQS